METNRQESRWFVFYTRVEVIIRLDEPEGDCDPGQETRLVFPACSVFPGRYLSGLRDKLEITCEESLDLTGLVDSASKSACKQVRNQEWGVK